MNELEMLEMAAKAAGLPWDQWVEDGDDSWNPLQDDGDALRLAVKTKVLFDIPSHIGKLLIEEGEQPSIEHAVRRAITRAAAQIGKSMP